MSVTSANQLNNANHVSSAILSSAPDPNEMLTTTVANTTEWEQNFEAKIKDLSPGEQEAVRRFWRSVVMRNAPRLFGDENGELFSLLGIEFFNNVVVFIFI
ncbi:unnamed protein product [Ceratitis capitata]|uniref:(Mediterranean fruit fly) hypothetical protein n=1 Tax=Ceratitis capitata TaxID=7213 RepID=A0A811V9C5_CERCA|nr:unnamed protein product [Ceratitis capitata]